MNLLAGRDGRTPIITYRRRKHKRSSKGTEGGFNSLTLIGDKREEEIRSNGRSEERGEDNVQSWEGRRTVTKTIKGSAPSARGRERNREKILRGEEDLSTGPRIPMLLGSFPEIQVTRIILTVIAADSDAAGADRSANVLDGGEGSSPSSPDPASDANVVDDIGEAIEYPVTT